jgi:hypothetical protein
MSEVANPCGLAAYSLFNGAFKTDTVSFFSADVDLTNSCDSTDLADQLSISEDDIAWKSDEA